MWSHPLSPRPFPYHHLCGLHANPAGPTPSGEAGLDHHSPTAQLVSSHRATKQLASPPPTGAVPPPST